MGATNSGGGGVTVKENDCGVCTGGGVGLFKGQWGQEEGE